MAYGSRPQARGAGRLIKRCPAHKGLLNPKKRDLDFHRRADVAYNKMVMWCNADFSSGRCREVHGGAMPSDPFRNWGLRLRAASAGCAADPKPAPIVQRIS